MIAVTIDPEVPRDLEEMDENYEGMYLNLLLFGIIETKEPAKVAIMLEMFCRSNGFLMPKIQCQKRHVMIEDDDKYELLKPAAHREYKKISKEKYYCCGTIILTW